jgi:hypothetical protein
MAGYPFDLGTYTRPVSTASPAAQAWFDRGLLWSYGFNHEEAVEKVGMLVAWARRTPGRGSGRPHERPPRPRSSAAPSIRWRW